MYHILSDFLGKKKKANSRKNKEQNDKKENIKKIKIYKKGSLYDGKKIKEKESRDNIPEVEIDDDEEYKLEEEEKEEKEFKNR